MNVTSTCSNAGIKQVQRIIFLEMSIEHLMYSSPPPSVITKRGTLSLSPILLSRSNTMVMDNVSFDIGCKDVSAPWL